MNDMSPQNHIRAGQDSRAYRDLRRMLRALPEEERFQFVLGMGELQANLAWALANTCVRKCSHLEALFRQGFLLADAHDMQFLLRAFAPRLGVVALARIIREYLSTSSSAVSSALYYIHRFASGQRERDAICRLENDAHMSGISVGPVRTPA